MAAFKLPTRNRPRGRPLHEVLRHLDRPLQLAGRGRLGLIRHVRIVEHADAAQLQRRGRQSRDLQVDAPQPLPRGSPVAVLVNGQWPLTGCCRYRCEVCEVVNAAADVGQRGVNFVDEYGKWRRLAPNR